jgi:hypothetical protein
LRNPIPTPALPLKVREVLGGPLLEGEEIAGGGRSFEKMGSGRKPALVFEERFAQ